MGLRPKPPAPHRCLFLGNQEFLITRCRSWGQSPLAPRARGHVDIGYADRPARFARPVDNPDGQPMDSYRCPRGCPQGCPPATRSCPHDHRHLPATSLTHYGTPNPWLPSRRKPALRGSRPAKPDGGGSPGGVGGEAACGRPGGAQPPAPGGAFQSVPPWGDSFLLNPWLHGLGCVYDRVRSKWLETRMFPRPPLALVLDQPCTCSRPALHFFYKKCSTT